MTYEQRKAWVQGIIIGLMGAVVAVGVSNKMRDAANECTYRPSALAKAILRIDAPLPPACAKAKVAPLALTK